MRLGVPDIDSCTTSALLPLLGPTTRNGRGRVQAVLLRPKNSCPATTAPPPLRPGSSTTTMNATMTPAQANPPPASCSILASAGPSLDCHTRLKRTYFAATWIVDAAVGGWNH